MTRARAFTLLEMMLAITVGAIVISIAMSMFIALDRAQSRMERRFEASLGLGRIRLAASRALEQLLVANSDRPADLDEPENLETLLRDGGASLGSERPRFILEPDPGLPLMEWQPDPQQPVELIQPQRFEVALRSAPVYALAAGGDSLALDDAAALDDLIESMRRAEPRPARRSRDTEGSTPGDEDDPAALDDGSETDDEPTEEEEQEVLEDVPLAPGVRGVFELTPDEGLEPGDPLSWTLWWRVIGNSFETGTLDAALDASNRAHLNLSLGETLDDRRNGTRVKLAERLRTVRWTARRDGESLDRLVVVWWRDLPAYVELETQTFDGRWNKWMFEVSWTQGPEPGTPQSGQPAPGDETDDEDGEGGENGPSIPREAEDAIDAAIGIGGGK